MLHISSVEPNKGNLVCFDIGFALFQDDLFHYVKFKFILSLNLLCEKSLMPKYNWLFVYIFSASQLNLWNSKFKSTVSLRQKRILWKKTNLPTRENIQGLKRQTRFSQILILPIQWQKRWFTTDELYIFFLCVWTLQCQSTWWFWYMYQIVERNSKICKKKKHFW